MNKAELVEAIAKKTGVSKAMADTMIDAFIDAITVSLKKSESVTLVGFGTFSQGKRAARAGRNPQTGAAIKIPAANTAQFAAGARLKAAVNGRKEIPAKGFKMEPDTTRAKRPSFFVYIFDDGALQSRRAGPVQRL